MRRMRIPRHRIPHLLRIPMVCGDKQHVPVLTSGVVDRANCSVSGCDSFDGGLEYTSVADLLLELLLLFKEIKMKS